MFRVFTGIGCLLTCCSILLSPMMAVAQTESALSEPEQISISVSIFENLEHRYLAGPLSLFCPADTGPEDVLDILCDYAYLDSYRLEEGAVTSVTVRGNIYENDEDGNQWQLTINGQLPDQALLDAYADGETVLQDGDSLEWFYKVDEDHQPVIRSSDGYLNWSARALQNDLWQNSYNDFLNRACSWLRTNTQDSDTLYTLGSAGISVEHKYLTSVLREIVDSDAENPRALAVGILAVSFCGISATNVSGRNFVEQLENCPDVVRTDAALALIAADCNAYPLTEGATNDRSALINVMLAAQNADGSFPNAEDVDTPAATALFLTALAPYGTDQTVRDAVDKGLAYLSSQLDAAGGYRNEDGTLSTTTTASVITALSSLGVRLDDPRFLKGDQNLLEIMLQTQLDSGGFAEGNGDTPSPEATRSAILAMVSQKVSGNPYLLRTPVTGEGTPLLDSSEPVSEEAVSAVSEPEEKAEPEDFLIGAAGLAVGLLLGGIVLVVVIRIMKKASKE